MYQNIKQLFYRRPYLTATASGILLTVLLVDNGLVLALPPILIGFVIGRNRIARWYDVFKQFPAALGCFVIVTVFYLFIGTTFGILRELAPIFHVYLSAHAIPLLLVGEWIGWVLRPPNHLIDRPAAR